MIPSVVLQLALWTYSASAFFPYTPVWLKEKEELALLAEAKRDAVTNSAKAGVAFAIEQRAFQNDDSPAQRASKQAAWLKSKFSHAHGGGSADVDVSIGRRSGNSYKIQDATKPTHPMAAGIHQDGTDYSYFVKAQLGSNNKELFLLIDTGAGSSWVMGSTCTDKPCTMHNTFGSGDSDTFVDNQKSFSISYGSGTVQGSLVSDTINVAGISVKYTFGLASKTSNDFARFAFDGILGMSMKQGASDNFPKALVDGKKLEKNIYGIALNRAADGTNNGEIRFGATNPEKYTGDISYTSVDSKGDDWSIQIDDMAYDGKRAGSGGVLAYIDTGTSFVFGPSDKVKRLHAIIPGSASGDGLTYTVPCDSKEDLAFTFSGVDYKLSSEDWISPKNSEGECTSNIYGHEVIQGAWLLGDTFLKNVYTVFDRDQGRIGFAAAAGSQGSTTSSTPSGDGSTTRTTVGPTTGTATTSTTDKSTTEVTSQSGFSTQSKGLPLGLGGHESGATSATESGSAAAKPTESSNSAAADVRPSQYAKMVVVISSMATLALTA
ncbi:hypothetical protein C2857_001746 [Epichloe festucae Fl1]|uniref:Peptidase A1 domain-containing protein n=1 Tax=Epichloe festucae (strain Fl1) TaxID=877507 RepID=A0A7S9PRN1_EPIFF|nr:hypothetical protein C2857_001746 [Epichloe festucae Fl1]